MTRRIMKSGQNENSLYHSPTPVGSSAGRPGLAGRALLVESRWPCIRAPRVYIPSHHHVGWLVCVTVVGGPTILLSMFNQPTNLSPGIRTIACSSLPHSPTLWRTSSVTLVSKPLSKPSFNASSAYARNFGSSHVQVRGGSQILCQRRSKDWHCTKDEERRRVVKIRTPNTTPSRCLG
jgi:hypothetical protein